MTPVSQTSAQVPISSFVKYATRLQNAASANVAYTGVGFQPRALFAFDIIGAALYQSHGHCDSAKNQRTIYWDLNTSKWLFYDGGFIRISEVNGVTEQYCSVASLDADGFTLNWVKVGAPSAGTISFSVLCLR